MQKDRLLPLELCTDTLVAVTRELTEFLSSYVCTGATSKFSTTLSKELETLIRRHCPICQGTLAIICGDHQLGVYPKDEVIALLFMPPSDSVQSPLADGGFENSNLHDALLDANYTILAYTTTSISLVMTSNDLTLFYHVALITDPASYSFYDRSMNATLSKLYLSSPDAMALYLLLWKMGLHSAMKQSTLSLASHHGEQLSKAISSTFEWLILPEELLYLRLHLHLLTLYFITAYSKKRIRTVMPDKSKGASLLTMLISLADHIADLQRETAVRPSCIVTDWSICSLIQGPTAVKLGVPETGSLYFASYGLAGLLPFNDKGGYFLVFLMTMSTTMLKLLSAMKLRLQPDKYYLSILIGNYQLSSTTAGLSPLSNQSTPQDLSFRVVIASSETSSVPSSLHSTPTQKRTFDTTDTHTPLP
ncbi:Hypothetical protein GLP15_3710 [Giardia lamblia P15]|uniref:Uncharacterized protein n=1 Tax=Giardia intestinalis (strain P15) TaxID=658858 RepID=E1F5U3_GIAIA|nr:Hypothetical protein GLP15_3710 [Giardia lamblia P15]